MVQLVCSPELLSRSLLLGRRLGDIQQELAEMLFYQLQLVVCMLLTQRDDKRLGPSSLSARDTQAS